MPLLEDPVCCNPAQPNKQQFKKEEKSCPAYPWLRTCLCLSPPKLTRSQDSQMASFHILPEELLWCPQRPATLLSLSSSFLLLAPGLFL